MRSQKLLGLVGMLAMAAIALAIFWPQRAEPTSRVTKENYDRLTYSMSGKEVEAILGPPGDYRNGPTVAVKPPTVFVLDAIDGKRGPGMAFEPELLGPSTYTWETDSVKIMIKMDRPCEPFPWCDLDGPWSDGVLGTVSVARCENMIQFERSPLDNLLWRAKRQWRKWFP